MPETLTYLTPAEVRALLGVIRRPRDVAMFTVAFWRGLRASEIGQIGLDCLDLERLRLRVPRLKGSYSGEYRLAPEEVKALRAWLRVRGPAPGPLFPSRLGRPISRFQVFALMRRYAAAAGLPPEKSHPHVLKHSIATLLLDRGLGIADVQDWLGHKAIKSTMVYARITGRRREENALRVYAVPLG